MMVRKISMIHLFLVVLFLVPLAGVTSGGNDPPSRTDASTGLPQSTDSFSSVEVFDSDRDGLDEMYMGGSGFRDGNVLTEGIRAFEYSPSSGSWEPFGSGLPEDGSGLYYGALGLGDVNGDGNMDIAAPIPSRWYAIDENGVDIYAGDGSGSFSRLHRIPLDAGTSGSSNEAEIADLDNDGRMDVAVSTYTGVKVFFGDGSGTSWTESSPTHLKGTEISGIGIGDLDGDGLLDIVGTPYQRSTDVEMYVQGARRTWRDVPFKDTSAGFGTKIADLDGDGDSDVVYGTASEGIKVWLGEGTVTLTEFPCTEAGEGLPRSDGHWDQVELGDVNGDGRPDLIASVNSEGNAHLYLNELPTGWSEIFTGIDALVVGGDAYGANFGDWNGDGQIDCAACGWEDGANAWLISTGSSGGNRPPMADAGRDRTVEVGDTVTLDGSGSSDPDGTITTWEWRCVTDPSLTLTDPDEEKASFTPSSGGILTFALRVKDDEGSWSSEDQVVMTVIDPLRNQPPVADAGSSISADVGEMVSLDGSESYDIDGEVVGYGWSCTSHSVTIQDPDGPSPSFTPEIEGDYVFRLIVTDDDGADSDPDTVTVHVASVVFYPRIGPFLYEDSTPVSGAIVTLTGDGSEQEAMTDGSGYASFDSGLVPGEYSCSLEKDGKTLLEPFGIRLKDIGTVSVTGGSIPRVPVEKEGSDRTVIYIVIAILAVVILGSILFIIVRSRKPQAEEGIVTVTVNNTAPCKNCGTNMEYKPDFNRLYCPTCQEYI